MTTLSTTPARRGVLSELDVNSPIATGEPTMGGQATRAEKPSVLGEVSLQKPLKAEKIGDENYHKPGLLGTKRRDNDLAEALDGAPRKVPKLEAVPGQELRGIHAVRTARSLGSRHWSDIRGVDQTNVYQETCRSGHEAHAVSSTASSPTSASPASSTVFSETALNDTQLTLPDEPRSGPLTQAELREKARAMRLRLRLANYKVRTNQITIPMSRLQIRTTNFDRLPAHRMRVPKSTPRTPLPSTLPTLSRVPDIKLRRPSAEKSRVPDALELLSSSPPPMLYTNSNRDRTSVSPTKEGEERDGFATPLLPRHRQGLLNPPSLGSPTREELTSSVVKRGTADVLLSLKLQRRR